MLRAFSSHFKRGTIYKNVINSFSSVNPSNFKLRVIFGSQSGTAEAFANELEFDAQENNVTTEVIDALKFKAEDLIGKKDDKVVNAFVVACYGEGDPTDNAKNFFKSLETMQQSTVDSSKSLKSSKFAVFGLGNSQCFRDRYNVVGKKLDKMLEELGGERVVSLGLGDASISEGNDSMTESFSQWKQQILKVAEMIAKEQTISGSQSFRTETADSSTSSSSKSPSSESSVTHSSASLTVHHYSDHSVAPVALSERQKAMIPSHRTILLSTASNVKQLFSRTDEFSSAVEVEFDLSKTAPLFGVDNNDSFTKGLQAGDHIGVFAPNSKYIVKRFALAAGLSEEDLDQPFPGSSSVDEEPFTLRQILTWQTHLSGGASLTSIKLLQRWLKDQPNLSLTAKLFSQLEEKYDSLVRDKGHDTAAVLDMIPKLPSKNGSPPAKLPIMALLKTLPALNPRLYSITHMKSPRVVTGSPVSSTCSVTGSSVPPASTIEYSKMTLLCRLVRYRQIKSSVNRVVDGVCSSYLSERLVNDDSKVAIFFRESNFHLPVPVTVHDNNTIPQALIMIAGGSGIAPFLSFLEERKRVLENPNLKIGPAVLYFGCRTNDEYVCREELVSYLGNDNQSKDRRSLNRLVVSFSTHNDDRPIQLTQSVHSDELVNQQEEHIPQVFMKDKEYLLPLIRDEKAILYVCGGAGKFGGVVRETVNAIAMEAFNIKELKDEHGREVVHPGIRQLIAEKRYFEDLAD
jgi:NADPH-ferrihemoprotein reductase